MTPAQIATFKTALAANAASYNLADYSTVLAWYNASSGAGFYWRPTVPLAELNTAIDWTVFAGLTALVQNTYMAMTQAGSVDATSLNIRNGFAAVFPNSPGTAATLAALTAIAKRVPTRLEALFTSANICTAPGIRLVSSDIDAAA